MKLTVFPSYPNFPAYPDHLPQFILMIQFSIALIGSYQKYSNYHFMPRMTSFLPERSKVANEKCYPLSRAAFACAPPTWTSEKLKRQIVKEVKDTQNASVSLTHNDFEDLESDKELDLLLRLRRASRDVLAPPNRGKRFVLCSTRTLRPQTCLKRERRCFSILSLNVWLLLLTFCGASSPDVLLDDFQSYFWSI